MEIGGLLYDPQMADIFSAFIVILDMLGGNNPASWTLGKEADELTALEDMERAVIDYHNPTVIPSTCYITVNCLPHAHAILSTPNL